MKNLEKLKVGDFLELSDQDLKVIMGGAYDPDICEQSDPMICGGYCSGNTYFKTIYAPDGSVYWYPVNESRGCQRLMNVCICVGSE